MTKYYKWFSNGDEQLDIFHLCKVDENLDNWWYNVHEHQWEHFTPRPESLYRISKFKIEKEEAFELLL